MDGKKILVVVILLLVCFFAGWPQEAARTSWLSIHRQGERDASANLNYSDVLIMINRVLMKTT